VNVQIKKIDQKKQELGYPVFRNNLKDYNLNAKPDHFDDIVVIDWWDLHNIRNIHTWEITTDPGLYWLKKPMNVNGTAIVCHDQFVRGAFKPGYHKGYKAMIQNNYDSFYVWRDNNKNKILDYSGLKYNDVTGLNWHHAYNVEKVGPYSAGCQVHSKIKDQQKSYAICAEGYKTWGPISACWLWGDFLL
jgi:hypothetical protein